MNTPTSTTPPTTKEDLTNLLEFEINQLHATNNSAGWSLSALATSAAALLWLSAQRLHEQPTTWNDVALYGVLFSTLVDIGILGHALIAPATSRDNQKRRFRWLRDTLGPTRTFFATGALRALALANATWHVSASLNIASYCAIVILWCLEAFFCVVLLVSSFLPIPTARNAKRQRIHAVLDGAALIVCVSAFSAAVYSFPAALSPTALKTMQTAAVGTVTLLLILLTVAHTQPSPLLQTLHEIRRDLGLGKLTLENAIERTDIAIEGLSTPHYLNAHVAKIIEHFDHATAILDEIQHECENYRELHPASERGNWPASEDDFAKVDRHLEEIKRLQEEHEERLYLFSRLDAAVEADTNDYKRRVDSAARGILTRVAAVRAIIKSESSTAPPLAQGNSPTTPNSTP